MVSVKFSFILAWVWTLLLPPIVNCVEQNKNVSTLTKGTNVNSTEGIYVNSTRLPIKTMFKLPSPLPSWPPGGDFATGVIDLGGLHIRQVSYFQDSWTTNQGGHDGIGVTFFHPSPTSIPDGFSMLGAYAQPNNKPLFGSVLVGKTDARDVSGPILKPPVDYTLHANTAQNTTYFWLPTPPKGFMPVGLVVTASPDKPSLDQIRCVRSDFTDEPETDAWIWGESGNGMNAYSLRPKTRGTKAQALSAGSFIVRPNNRSTAIPVACLKNKNPSSTSNPNLAQIQALFKTYSPYIYFHPHENYLPSSVNWFFLNGALLYERGHESNPMMIEQSGSNLPQGGTNDGSYWMDLPPDDRIRGELKRGDDRLIGPAYLHVKPVLGSTCTDIQIWIFYPFNGHGVLKFGPIRRIGLGRIGEHVGDWEHVTLRISNFDGALQKVYFAEHAGGAWVDASELEYRDGNKVVAYASLNGHASYSRAGLVLLGGGKGVGIRDDTAVGPVMDTGVNYSVIAAEGLSAEEAVAEPAWLNYSLEWGPKIAYDLEEEVGALESGLIRPLRKLFRKIIAKLPPEFFGEEGPTGPKMKSNWHGDEI